MSVYVARKARAITVAALLFGVSLFLTAYSARNPEVGKIGSAVISTLLAPLQHASSSASSYAISILDSYIYLVNVKQTNEALQEQLDSLRADRVKYEELAFENAELKNLLEFKKEKELNGVVARVIGFDSSNWKHTVTINKGKLDGVMVGAPVVKEYGTVGHVIISGNHHARVLLIIDHESAVDVLVQRTRARGLLAGRGTDGCILEFVMKDEDARAGDVVITSGIDGIYPKGLMVGTINQVNNETRTLFQEISLTPAVDFGRLENVFVLLP